jgi:hypothetical protein
MPRGVTCGQKYAAQFCREGLANFAEKKLLQIRSAAGVSGSGDHQYDGRSADDPLPVLASRMLFNARPASRKGGRRITVQDRAFHGLVLFGAPGSTKSSNATLIDWRTARVQRPPTKGVAPQLLTAVVPLACQHWQLTSARFVAERAGRG